MKQLTSLFLALLTLTATAQVNYPYNPDGNADAFISTPDLMEFLVVFGYEWEQEEIQVDSIPLSMYLSSLEAMIEASALPGGTVPGQFLQWTGASWELIMPRVGCTVPEACNYDETAHVLLESMCVLPDACGVCGGPGAVYACGCADITEGECDCDGNVVDALGVCGGTCEADEDGDGICDDGDSCVGQADECGVCNGPGATYDCGCTEPIEGTCDCDGNVEDVLGECGGSCTADEDLDGICDDVDDCVGAYDGCGVCNGPGPVLGCGCNNIPEGFCDCNGNVLDAVGTCGGACENDLNGDGICDDGSIPGCTYSQACNYDPSASIYDGSCDFTSCYGCTDPTACNYSSLYTVSNGSCVYPGCTDVAACNFDVASGCDDGSCAYPGCNDSTACNFDIASGCDDGSCVYPGCIDPEACNWDEVAACDDGSCTYPGCTTEGFCNYDAAAGCDDDSCENESCYGCMDTTACNFSEYATTDDGSCDFLCYGCIDAVACNYDETLTLDDGSCVYPGCDDAEAVNFDEAVGCNDGSCLYAGCTIDLACNFNPVATIEDGSCEFGTCPGCNDPSDFGYNPTSTNDSLCGTSAYFTNCGAEGRFGPTQLQCDVEYGPGVVSSSGGVQQWTVTQSGVYRIEARGAMGGHTYGGGLGAAMAGTFILEVGQQINVVVGQKGGEESGNINTSGGGGGGTFVYEPEETLMIAAGGGGGLCGYQGGTYSWPTINAVAETTGNFGSGWNEGTGGAGGTSGASGENAGCGLAGLGWLHSGPWVGGELSSVGGFGGGGGGGACYGGGGGGGGYSGGGAGTDPGNGGGGGSYNSGSNQVNEGGVNEGHGSVTIILISAQ